MAENKEIVVLRSTQPNIVVNCPDFRFRRAWKKSGSKHTISKEQFEEICTDRGVQNMIAAGYIVVDGDKTAVSEAGIVEIGKEYTPEQIRAVISAGPVALEKAIGEMNKSSIENMLDLIKTEPISVDTDQIAIIEKVTGHNLIGAIRIRDKELLDAKKAKEAAGTK